jgi:hypothetical protein
MPLLIHWRAGAAKAYPSSLAPALGHVTEI